MVEIQIKYGNSAIPYEIPEKNLWEIVTPKKEPSRIEDPKKEIRRALQNPIGTPILSKIIKPGSNIVITQDDHTRGTPGYLVLPPLLDALNSCGIPDDHITVVFACGIHRAVTPEEQKALVGEAVLDRVVCLSHDCDATDLVRFGLTSRKVPVEINSVAAKADYLIATGKCEYHYYAGFSGGRKSVFPGLASRKGIDRNHSLMIDDRAITGNFVGNPVHEDMLEAAKMTNTTFILNIVQNTENELVRAFAGDLVSAHLAAAKFYDSLYRIQVKGLADIVLVGAGYPKDIDLYQAHKAIDNAQRIVRPGGVIVSALECRDGYGNPVFYEWAKRYRTYEQLEAQVRTEFQIGGHKAYYFAKVRKKAKLILVSSLNQKELKEIFMLEPAKTVEDAMEMAYSWVGRNAKVTFMPNGTITLPALPTSLIKE
ncbi:MAG: nickel-dependent lactate racemase [Candidatus Helarchaeota archaeon]|nr:nickel-dependent lactate racemase [Candidatus Helarchaeota archaeon]